MDILHYRKIDNNKWEAYDLQGNTAIGITKNEAKRLYYLYYKISFGEVNGHTRKGLIPTEQLTLDKK